MSLTSAQYMLVSELLDEVHDVKKEFIKMKQKVYELEDENYRLKERINELYSMINAVDCTDEIEQLNIKLADSVDRSNKIKKTTITRDDLDHVFDDFDFDDDDEFDDDDFDEDDEKDVDPEQRRLQDEEEEIAAELEYARHHHEDWAY